MIADSDMNYTRARYFFGRTSDTEINQLSRGGCNSSRFGDQLYISSMLVKVMSYDYFIRQEYYSLAHPEDKSLSVQSPPYRLETQNAERHLGQNLEACTTY